MKISKFSIFVSIIKTMRDLNIELNQVNRLRSFLFRNSNEKDSGLTILQAFLDKRFDDEDCYNSEDSCEDSCDDNSEDSSKLSNEESCDDSSILSSEDSSILSNDDSSKDSSDDSSDDSSEDTSEDSSDDSSDDFKGVVCKECYFNEYKLVCKHFSTFPNKYCEKVNGNDRVQCTEGFNDFKQSS